MADNQNANNNANSNKMDWHQKAGPVFKYGLIVGFGLILLGGISLWFYLMNVYLGTMVVCAGLGIILGAFGSTATVNIPGKSMVLAGVAGIAVALSFVVNGQMDESYVRLKISGDIDESQMELVGDRNYLGAYISETRTYDFVIFGKKIELSTLKLFITLKNNEERPFTCIKRDLLRPYLASGKTIEWQYNGQEDTLIDPESNKVIVEMGPCKVSKNEVSVNDSVAIASFKYLPFSFVTEAFAQTPSDQAKKSTDQLIQQLDSRANYIRQEARLKLAEQGVSAVRPLYSKLSEEPITYQSKLGVFVALTEIMRKYQPDRSEIVGITNNEDLHQLVRASIDEDKGVRVYASEYLIGLGDPRAINVALNQFPDASPDGKYNLLLIIKNAIPFADAGLKADLKTKVLPFKSNGEAKTNDLIDSIVKDAGN